MSTAVDGLRYAYDIGEDVVVRLDGIELYDVDAGKLRCRCARAAWTLAVVSGRTELAGAPAYVLNAGCRGARVICVAPESAIDGVA